jgi:hypothetical protein
MPFVGRAAAVEILPAARILALSLDLSEARPTAKRADLQRRAHTSAMGLVSRVTPVHTAMRNCTRDEGRPFEVGNQVLISSHRELLSSKATVVNVAEKSEQDFDR